MLLFKPEKGCNSKKEWAACAKPAKTLGTRLTNGKVDESANQKVSEGAITAMATLDDNWQTKHPTISERTKFIFNNELLSDVKFAVPVSHNESKSRKSQTCMIPAHKFILAISSPVFYAMFYGEMAETSGTIQFLTVIMRVSWSCFVFCTAMK